MLNSEFLCARTSKPCQTPELCGRANEALVGAVDNVVSRTESGPGLRATYAAACLVRALEGKGHEMQADFAPTADAHDATICPSAVIERPAPGRLTKEEVATAVGFVAAQAIDEVVVDLRLQGQRRQRGRR